jgi:uncharacterized phage protein (TIGR02220 family)
LLIPATDSVGLFLRGSNTVASGKKNYFRHSFHARKHPAIAGLIDDLGKEAYFHFFALVEVCAEQASDRFPDDSRFVFRRSTLCHDLLVTNSRLSRHLLAMVPSLVDDVVVTEKTVEILFPKLAKYMGRYDSKLDSNSPNKRKEKEIKENKSKEKEDAPSASPVLEIVAEKNLPEIQPQDFRNPKDSEKTNTELFAVDSIHPLEETPASDLARNVLTSLNAICFTNYRPTKANMKFINARINEGYSLEEFTKVFTHKQEQWGSDSEMRQYLRPSTLLNGKFDSYLQAANAADAPMSEEEATRIIQQYWPGA